LIVRHIGRRSDERPFSNIKYHDDLLNDLTSGLVVNGLTRGRLARVNFKECPKTAFGLPVIVSSMSLVSSELVG